MCLVGCIKSKHVTAKTSDLDDVQEAVREFIQRVGLLHELRNRLGTVQNLLEPLREIASREDRLLTEKDKTFLETLRILMDSKDLWVNLRRDQPSYMILRGTYGDKVYKSFRMNLP